MTDPAPTQPPAAERIPGHDFCPLDGEPLWLRIQSGGKPQLYIHADKLTWHVDASEKIRAATWESPFTGEASGSPEAMLREIFAAQPPAAASEAERVLAGLVEEMHLRMNATRISSNVGIGWMDGMKEAIALVEAAQQRLDGERGQERG